MNISGMDSGSASMLFSGLNKGSNSGLYSSLGDYSSIKSGSYGKLLSSYYQMNSSGSAQGAQAQKSQYSHATDHTSRGYRESYLKAQEEKANSTTNKNQQSYINKTQSQVNSANSSIASSSNEAVTALDDLRSADMFKQTSAGLYNTDNIYKAVTNYVDSYNNMIDKASDSKASGVTSNVNAMQSTTKTYASQLSSVGITIGDDGKLSVNEDTFKKSDMQNVKNLFDRGGYGYSVRTNAYMTGYYAKQAVSSSGTYGSNGGYSLSDIMSNFQTSI